MLALAVFDDVGRLPDHDHVLKGTLCCCYQYVPTSTSWDLEIEADARFPGDD
jgi:hypothetical protein